MAGARGESRGAPLIRLHNITGWCEGWDTVSISFPFTKRHKLGGKGSFFRLGGSLLKPAVPVLKREKNKKEINKRWKAGEDEERRQDIRSFL